MRSELSRRQLLGAVGTGLVAATAGCAGGGSTNTMQVAVGVKVNESKLNDAWNETMGSDGGSPEAAEEFEKRRKEITTEAVEDFKAEVNKSEDFEVVDESVESQGLLLVEAPESQVGEIVNRSDVQAVMDKSEFENYVNQST